MHNPIGRKKGGTVNMRLIKHHNISAKKIDPLQSLSVTMKNYFVNTSLLVLSITCAFLIIEGLFRIITPLENIPQREYDPDLGWRGRPDLRCILNEKLFTIHITQNSRGFRDSERAFSSMKGTRRILCLGDSFTWGWGVDQNEVYTALLQEMLVAQKETNHEIINAGVGGYSTDQSLQYLKKEGVKYSPEIVIYQVAKNDIAGNTTSFSEGIYQKPYFTLSKDGNLLLHNSPILPMNLKERAVYFLSRHCRLAYFMKHRVHIERFWRKSESPEVQLKEGDLRAEVDIYPFRLFCALVQEMRRESEANGARFVAIIDFSLTEEEQIYWTTQCGGIEMHLIDKYLLERGRNSGQSAYIPEDGHWSVHGHKWVAEYLYNQVI